jgi:hypothetical protein
LQQCHVLICKYKDKNMYNVSKKPGKINNRIAKELFVKYFTNTKSMLYNMDSKGHLEKHRKRNGKCRNHE